MPIVEKGKKINHEELIKKIEQKRRELLSLPEAPSENRNYIDVLTEMFIGKPADRNNKKNGKT
jgi:hypothetical protein